MLLISKTKLQFKFSINHESFEDESRIEALSDREKILQELLDVYNQTIYDASQKSIIEQSHVLSQTDDELKRWTKNLLKLKQQGQTRETNRMEYVRRCATGDIEGYMHPATTIYEDSPFRDL